MDFNKIKEIFRSNSSQILTPENKALLRTTLEIEGIRIKKEDIYRNNKEFQSFDDEKKIQIMLIISAMSKSRVVKVCKDKFNIKRRVPFVLNSKITSQINAHTVFIESQSDLTLDNLTQFLKSFAPRDIRIKSGYATAELENEESVKKIMAASKEDQSGFVVYSKDQWE